MYSQTPGVYSRLAVYSVVASIRYVLFLTCMLAVIVMKRSEKKSYQWLNIEESVQTKGSYTGLTGTSSTDSRAPSKPSYLHFMHVAKPLNRNCDLTLIFNWASFGWLDQKLNDLFVHFMGGAY